MLHQEFVHRCLHPANLFDVGGVAIIIPTQNTSGFDLGKPESQIFADGIVLMLSIKVHKIQGTIREITRRFPEGLSKDDGTLFEGIQFAFGLKIQLVLALLRDVGGILIGISQPFAPGIHREEPSSQPVRQEYLGVGA